MKQDDRDQDLKDVMDAEKRRGRSNRPIDAERERKLKGFAAGLLKVIQAKDVRALTELLKLYGIADGSVEWKRAWKVFYDA